VVWVGFDDNRPLDLEGAHSALPVWAEFMKRAHEHREYRNVSEFEPPAGVVSAQIDPASGQLATAACPKVRTEYFIEGTQPVEMCQLHGGGGTQVASWETAPPSQPSRDRSAGAQGRDRVVENVPPAGQYQASPAPVQPPKKKSLLDKLRSIFK
jgi:penicillin-binding protein 1B